MRISRFLTCVGTFFSIVFLGITVYLLVYLMPDASEGVAKMIVHILIIDNAVLCVISGIAAVCSVFAAAKKEKTDIPFVSKLLSLTESGEIKTEVDLTGKVSLVIGKSSMDDGELLYFSSFTDESYTASSFNEYAVLNAEGVYWYVESISSAHKIGLRKEYDTLIYQLKIDTPYKISKNDVIYISDQKILVK